MGKEGTIIGLVVAVILAVALLPVLWTTQLQATTAQTVSGESVVVTSGAGTLTYDNVVPDSETITNSSDAEMATPADYNLTDSTGVLAFAADDTYSVDYQYYSDSYVTDAPARTMLGLLTLFFAIGIIVAITRVAK